MSASGAADPLRVSAVIPAHNRPMALAEVLRRLKTEPVDQVIVVDNGSSTDLEAIAELSGAEYLRCPHNSGVAARNLGVARAKGDLILMLDDDSYPSAGAVATLRMRFEREPMLGALGGKVVDVTQESGSIVRTGAEVGSFDWFARFGLDELNPSADTPAFFFAEGACMLRRSAFRQVGGCFEPYFGELTELDLATRLIASGWDVRYLAIAEFHHMRSEEWRGGLRKDLRLRVRNQVWYFWRHFPTPIAVRRILAYLLGDFIECSYRGLLPSWVEGVSDAWRERACVRSTRQPLSRDVIRRAELHRGRAHVALLLHGLRAVSSRRWERS